MTEGQQYWVVNSDTPLNRWIKWCIVNGKLCNSWLQWCSKAAGCMVSLPSIVVNCTFIKKIQAIETSELEYIYWHGVYDIMVVSEKWTICLFCCPERLTSIVFCMIIIIYH